jgi:hypothetical protein
MNLKVKLKCKWNVFRFKYPRIARYGFRLYYWWTNTKPPAIMSMPKNKLVVKSQTICSDGSMHTTVSPVHQITCISKQL